MSGEMRFTETPELRVAYVESGPPDGEPVLLVHGFPDDARTWDRLAARLAEAGYRTLAPFVRGFAPTELKAATPRTGESAAIVRDLLAVADALELGRFHLVGHDWGARAAYNAAALAPERVRTVTALAVAYGSNVPGVALALDQVQAYWYQWYFATPRGAEELTRDRDAFCRYLWQRWSPAWSFDDAEFRATAISFGSPDFVEIVLTSYRQRWGFIPGDAAYAAERARIEAVPPIGVPALALMGALDGATLPSSAAGTERHFRGPYRVETVAGAGHFLQREAADDVAERVLAHLRAYGSP